MKHVALLLMMGFLFACSQEMDNQPKYKTYRPTEVGWTDPARQPVKGTIPRGHLPRPVPDSLPVPVTRELLEHGQERFNIYCSPCHSELGDGDGRVVRRGYPPPPSYHSPRLRAVSDGHIYQVIRDGHGIMYSYAARVPPDDRWAIVAYIRALQLSQHAPVALLQAQEAPQ